MSKQKKYHYIYETICITTGRFYRGMHSTDNLKDGYLGSGKILGYSRNKHDDENHKLEILEFLPTRDALKKREVEVVNEELLANPLCMNLKYGGDGGWDHINSDPNHLIQSLAGKIGGKIGGKVACEKYASDRMKSRHDSGEKIGFNNPLFQQVMTTRATEPQAIEKRKKTYAERDHQQGKNNSQFGVKRIGISKNGKIKKVLPEQIQEYLEAGWIKGFRN